jgi:hypothetical protein
MPAGPARDRQRATLTRLAAAPLYWVSTEMTAVALDASGDIPAWVPEQVMPSADGFLIWQGNMPPIRASDLNDNQRPIGPDGARLDVSVGAAGVMWSRSSNRVNLAVLSLTSDVVAAGATLTTSELVVPTGTAAISSAKEIDPAEMAGEAAGFIAALGATWVLMGQPTVAEPRTVTPKGTEYRAARRRRRDPPVVSIVDLRPMIHTPTDPTDEPGRIYTHRWVVRGHWRHQAYGPERTLRKAVWVPSYLKGPAGAPLLRTEHVHVWRR